MTPASRSIHVFGNYLVLLGVVLLVAPNPLLQLFGLPTTTEVWIRVVGMLVAFLGIYYRTAAAANLTPFYVATVLLRSSVPLFFLAFVLAGWVGWPLLLFGLIDAAGAIWTWSALRQPPGTA
jgi:protein-S-isoprenylcysteine O-methyltransferase Ste14